MKDKKKKLIYRVIIIVQLFVLIGVCTYAWFESNYDPIIYSDQMRITASDGLFVQLTDDPNDPRVNIKEVVRDFSSQFGLAQVSTVDGENFFKRRKTSTSFEYILAEKNSDYIDVSFMLSGETDATGSATNPDRYIYIKSLDMHLLDKDDVLIPDSSFARDTIRVALVFENTLDDGSTTKTEYLVCRDDVTGGTQFTRFDKFIDDAENPYGSSILKNMVNDPTNPTNGYELYSAISNKGIDEAARYGTQKVEYISQYIYNETLTDFDYLECIPSGKGIKVSIKIWLEGADPRCDLPISGSKIYFDLVFGSYYYKVDFNTNGAEKIKPLIFSSLNSPVGTLPTPTSGTGWYDGSTQWTESTIVNKNVTLEAK